MTGAYREPVATDDASTDASILAALDQARDEDWQALWDAVDALTPETSFATWSGGSDGQLPYPMYTQPVEELRERIGRLGIVVPFDWMKWDGVRRYKDDPAALQSAPVADAVRLVIAILRSERFTDGSIEGALQSGLMQTALARLRRWHEEDRIG